MLPSAGPGQIVNPENSTMQSIGCAISSALGIGLRSAAIDMSRVPPSPPQECFPDPLVIKDSIQIYEGVIRETSISVNRLVKSNP